MHDLDQALEAIYGPGVVEQRPRYRNALQAFAAQYGEGPVTLFRAPGRVNLIGEHTDYNHGYVLPAALDRDILLLTRPRPDAQIRLANVEAEFPFTAFDISAAIPPGPVGDWSNYARGAAQMLAQALPRTPTGFNGLVDGIPPFGVPRGAGLSSSSALTVVTAVTLAHYADWQPSAVEMARFCSDAEWYVGTRGGIMDQFIALLARRNHALFLDCRPDAAGNYSTDHLPLPRAYRLLVVDSGVKHSNVRNQFNQRVGACRAGVALLRRKYPAITHLRDVESIEWAALEPLLPDTSTVAALQQQGVALGDLPGLTPNVGLKVRACCRHVWSENRRVLAAVEALRAGDVERLGELLDAAHASARDDYEISCPELEVLVEAAGQADGVAGARLTGAGWGGCIIALVHEEAVDEFAEHVRAVYHQRTGQTAAVFPCRVGPGAGLVAKVTPAG